MKTSDVQSMVSELLTTQQVCELLRRTEMSLSYYRNRERDPLPAVMMSKSNRVVGYVKDDVYDWARRNAIKVYDRNRVSRAPVEA